MLQRIKVRNYAIIDEIDIDFCPQLNIITGETGAGKSILLGALGLILGNRADTKTFFNSDEKCIIEAEFHISAYHLQEWFEAHDLDYEDITIIRREIQPAGKNRVFINDTPVNLQQLQELSAKLVDIHQQFSLYDIQKPTYQLTLYDAYSNVKSLQATYTQGFKRHHTLLKKKQDLEALKNKSLQEADYLRYQLSELDQIPFETYDVEKLEEELELIENAGVIKATAGGAHMAIYEDEQSIVSMLDQIISRFSPLAKLSPGLKEFADRLYSVKLELQELADEFSRLADNTEMDEERALEIREQLDALYKLFSKHQVSDTNALLQLKNEVTEKLNSIANIDEEIESLQADILFLEKDLFAQADEMSNRRKSSIPAFTQTVMGLLHELGMPHARFDVQILDVDHLTPTGINDVQFLFSANPGSAPAPIKDVASGGEISRLTLAIKSLVASSIPLPTMIFDEIDTGLGGEIALKMSLILRKLAENHQLIAITHSPQLASKAHKHLFVYKEVDNDKTTTRIKTLNVDERIENIAIMLSTKPPTKAALENARELIA